MFRQKRVRANLVPFNPHMVNKDAAQGFRIAPLATRSVHLPISQGKGPSRLKIGHNINIKISSGGGKLSDDTNRQMTRPGEPKALVMNSFHRLVLTICP